MSKGYKDTHRYFTSYNLPLIIWCFYSTESVNLFPILWSLIRIQQTPLEQSELQCKKYAFLLHFVLRFNHYPQGKVTLFSLKSFYFVTLFQEKEKCNDFLLYVRSYIDL